MYSAQQTVCFIRMFLCSSVVSLEWDSSGELLAILQGGCSTALVWSLATQRLQEVESCMLSQMCNIPTLSWRNPQIPTESIKEATFVKWSQLEPQVLMHRCSLMHSHNPFFLCVQLAIGSARGTTLFYNYEDDPFGTASASSSSNSSKSRRAHAHSGKQRGGRRGGGRIRFTQSKQKKRILCGDWSADNHFAFASEDKQVRFTHVDSSRG